MTLFLTQKYQTYFKLLASINANILLLSLALLCSACAFQSYQAKPISAQITANDFEKRSVSDENFISYLQNKGYSSEQLPLKSWDLNALIDCALFFHPNLNVARAQLSAAQASEALASKPNLPTLNGNIARSDRANGDINPFAYQFSIDIPINTHNKREIQIESFSHLTEVAKLEIAQTAWNLRQPIALTLSELKWLDSQLKFSNQQTTLQQQVLSMLEKRKLLGLESSIEVSQATLQLQSINAAKSQLAQNKVVALGNLAQQIGLPISVVNAMPLNLADIKTHPDFPNEDLQKSALLNRLDLRMALARYAVAEAKVKLEIAKQYPDISLNPGYAYEFGDKVWSLGFSSLLNLLKSNKAAIFEAEKLRDVEVAQFEALQADIIGQTNTANAALQQTQLHFSAQQKILKQQQAFFAKSQAQFNAGEIDRLTLTKAQLAFLNSEKEVAQAEYQTINAWFHLENQLQTPLVDEAKVMQAQINKEIK